MKRAKKIISVSVTTILSIILIFMVFVVISSKLSGGEPNFLGYQLKTVLSGSMEPTFMTGSVIAVKPIRNTDELKKNDIITFQATEDKLITHRIIDVVENGKQRMFITKGDNNRTKDENPVVAPNVVAKFTGVEIPYIGYLMNFAYSKNGMAFLLIFPGLILLAYSVVTIFKVLKELEQAKGNENKGII